MTDVIATTGPICIAILIGFAATRAGLFTRADMRILGTLVMTPVTYRVVAFLKRIEQVDGRVNAEPGLALEELGAEGALAEQRQAEVIAIEEEGAIHVGHEHATL